MYIYLRNMKRIANHHAGYMCLIIPSYNSACCKLNSPHLSTLYPDHPFLSQNVLCISSFPLLFLLTASLSIAHPRLCFLLDATWSTMTRGIMMSYSHATVICLSQASSSSKFPKMPMISLEGTVHMYISTYIHVYMCTVHVHVHVYMYTYIFLCYCILCKYILC